MRKIILYLIVLMAITNIHSLSAQTWSPPIRVSQYEQASWYYIMGHGLTVDSFGAPWCGWVVLRSGPVSNYILASHYNGTWSEPDTIIPFGVFMDCDLTADANGNVWIVAEDVSISACFYNGNSWSNLMQVPSQGTCCHYPVAIGDTLGNLWVCWAGGGPGDGHHVWVNTYIQGQWGSPVLISYPGSPEEFAYSMTADKNGRVWVGWSSWIAAIYCGEICASFNDGSGWSDTMVIAEYSYATYGPALTVDTSGKVWAGWLNSADSAGSNISACYYDGNTWSEPMLISSTAGWYGDFNVAMTSDNKGMVWLTWMNPDNDIYYSYWNGSNWSNPAPVDANPATDFYPRMAFDGERIWVAWIRRGEIAPDFDVLYASYTYGLDVEEPTVNPVSVPVLSQNYPNPFNGTTEIRYQIPEKADTRQKSVASMEIYDVSGRLVKQFNQLTNNQSPIIWDGKDENGKALPSGVYFYHIKAGTFADAKRMVLIH